VLEKVKYLHEFRMKASAPFDICVDGGVTIDNIKSVNLAGANEVAVGKRVIEGDIEKNIEKFLKAVY
jgi:pentose-5-phosphate-3-epimerase